MNKTCLFNIILQGLMFLFTNANVSTLIISFMTANTKKFSYIQSNYQLIISWSIHPWTLLSWRSEFENYDYHAFLHLLCRHRTIQHGVLIFKHILKLFYFHIEYMWSSLLVRNPSRQNQYSSLCELIYLYHVTNLY